MKEVNLHRDQLKKIDYPHPIPDDAAEVVQLSPETLLLSIAISAKRIADALEDGLTTITPDGKSVAGLADIAKSMEMKS